MTLTVELLDRTRGGSRTLVLRYPNNGPILWEMVMVAGDDHTDQLRDGVVARAAEYVAAQKTNESFVAGEPGARCAAITHEGTSWPLHIVFEAQPARDPVLYFHPYQLISYYVDTLEHMTPNDTQELCIDVSGRNFGVKDSVYVSMSTVKDAIARFREMQRVWSPIVKCDVYETGAK